MIYGETGTTPLHITIEKRMIGHWLQILLGSSSKLNYKIYKYISHLVYAKCILYSMNRKIKEILQQCGLFNILVNLHNIRVKDSKAIRLLICVPKLMINTNKLGTVVYLHTLDAHIMYYLKITGNWNHIYINYLPEIKYTYLNLDVEATI